MNKNGDISRFVVYLIIAFIIFVVITAILFVFNSANTGGLKSLPCTFSNSMKEILPGKIFNIFAGTMGSLRFCAIQNRIIDPQAWDKCNSRFREASIVDLSGAAKNCTMQQFLDMALSCWEMGGRGKIHPKSFKCFIGMVQLGTKAEETNIKSQDELRTFYKGDLNKEYGCLPGQKEKVILDEYKVGCRCDEVVNEIADKQTKLVISNSIISYYNSLLFNNASVYGMGSDGYLVYCGTYNMDLEQVTTNLVGLRVPAKADVERILASKVDVNKKGCEDVVSKVTTILIDMREQGSIVVATQGEMLVKLSTCVKEGEEPAEGEVGLPAGGTTTITDRVSYLMNATTKVTATPPAIGTISESDLLDFAKTVNSKNNVSYYFDLDGGKALELVGDYKISPSSMFEISFCDGEPLASGLGAFSMCSVWDETKVQVGTIGSGTGGVARGESPFCHMTSVLAGVPLAGSLDDFCHGRFWKSESVLQ